LKTIHAAALVALVGAVALSLPTRSARETKWSPYYKVDLDPSNGGINVNYIGHQMMNAFETTGSVYSLIHLLQQHSGGAPFADVLVIGAGSGNDVTHALRYGVQRLDAVEIDPVIQSIGI